MPSLQGGANCAVAAVKQQQQQQDDALQPPIDVAQGLEPVPVYLTAQSTAQLRSLHSDFHEYIVDSVWASGIRLDCEITAGVDEAVRCECSGSRSESESAPCVLGSGDECECIGAFGNFYTASLTGRQLLLLDALPPRLPLVECGPSCTCGARCRNKLTQSGVHEGLVVSPAASGVGLGLFYALSGPGALRSGSFVALYAGEYLSTAEARARWDRAHEQPLTEGTTNYTLSLRLPQQTLHIDPRHKGNIGRFLNHSCDPNCVIEIVYWGAAAVPRAAIFAKRDVQPGEELTFDYGNASGREDVSTVVAHEDDGASEGGIAGSGRTKCLCGTSSCRGWMPYDETL